MKERRLFAVSTKGTQRYDMIDYAAGDVFVFGPESRGLPTEILGAVAEQRCIRIPMVPESRSLNLSNAVAVVIYEAWRQVGFGTCRYESERCEHPSALLLPTASNLETLDKLPGSSHTGAVQHMTRWVSTGLDGIV